MKDKLEKSLDFMYDVIGGIEVRVLGENQDGSPLFVPDKVTSSQTLEDCLLRFRAKPWHRFVAKYIGVSVNLGCFFKMCHVDHMNWFLFWDSQCRRFTVSYKEGFEEKLVCGFCRNHQHLFPGSPDYKTWSRRTALPKDYWVLYF